jgi:hypothetical protein
MAVVIPLCLSILQVWCRMIMTALVLCATAQACEVVLSVLATAAEGRNPITLDQCRVLLSEAAVVSAITRCASAHVSVRWCSRPCSTSASLIFQWR